MGQEVEDNQQGQKYGAATAMRVMIYAQYISDHATVMVPAIKPETRKLITRLMNAPDPRPFVFDRALADIYDYLRMLFYEPFTKTKYYRVSVVCLFACLLVCLFACLLVCLFACLLVCLFACLMLVLQYR